MKLKVIGLLVATIFFIVLMVLAYESMWSDNRPANNSLTQQVDGNPAEDAQVVQAHETLYASFAELQKANDNYTTLLTKSARGEETDNAEKQVSQAEAAFKNTIDKVEINNSSLQSAPAKNSLSHVISSYRALLRFQSFENVSNNDMVAASTVQPDNKQMQRDLQSKNERIAQLEQQVRLLQNTKKNVVIKTVTPADYQELVAKNKYLDFDVRSVVKTNLALTKEYEALKKTNQELTRQLWQNKE